MINIFKNKRSEIWPFNSTNNNGYDCCAGVGFIKSDIKNAVRQNFEIGYNEEILLVRDTSFWNDRNQGLVITDKAVYCIPDNDKPDEKITFGWGEIDRVEYKDLVLYFWRDGDEECYAYIHIDFFLKDSSNNTFSFLGPKLASLFTEMAKAVAPEESLYDKVWSMSDSDIEGALELATQNRFNDISLFYPICYFYLISEHKYPEKTIQYATEGMNEILSKDSEEIEQNNYAQIFALLSYLRYSAYVAMEGVDNHKGVKENYRDCRKDALSTMLWVSDDAKRGDGKSIKDDAKDDFKIINAAFANDFLSLPYNERKLLYPCKEYSNLNQDFVSVIDLDNLKNTGINFPIGHPVANQLYVGHPFLPTKYMPFENYELELIEDKVREFCHIMQSLGATEIDIECINSSSGSTDSASCKNADGKVGNRLLKVAASGSMDTTSKFIEEISRSLNLHQRFSPKEAPKLPENLVWYKHEPAWQRIYIQRMQGSLLEHEERMETKKSQMVDNTELKQVSLEVEHLLADANVNYKQELKEKFEGHENAILAIRVKFANSDFLGNDSTVVCNDRSSVFSNEENEYLEEYKACLEDGGAISASERRLLERFRERLGVSAERAKEIEASLSKPQLTDAEKEYLEEYKACIEEDGEISPKERRLLNRIRESLGISEERANEIEKL